MRLLVALMFATVLFLIPGCSDDPTAPVVSCEPDTVVVDDEED